MTILTWLITGLLVYYFGQLIKDSSTIIIWIVPVAIGLILFLFAVFGLSAHRLNAKAIKFFSRFDKEINSLMPKEKDIEKSLVFERLRLYSAAMYLPLIMCGMVLTGSNFAPEANFKNTFILYSGILCIVFGLVFVALFYAYEYKSYNTVYPKIKFWQYFLIRLRLNR